MPRVRGLTDTQKIQYQKERVVDQLELMMRHKRIKRKTVADMVGLTPQAISNQFVHRNVSLDTVIAIVTLSDDPLSLRAE